MRFIFTRRSLAHVIFIAGFALIFLGSIFLSGSPAEISRIKIISSILFLLLGITGIILANSLKKRLAYLFIAVLFLQIGIFLFLSALHIVPVGLSKVWPLLSVFSGIALLPSGWHYYGFFKLKFIVPSAAFIVLGVVLLVFSLDLVPFSLVQFVSSWWPLLIILAGLTLILISLGTKNTGESKR
jgi:hypothetical protein